MATRRPTRAPAAIMTGLWSSTIVQSDGWLLTVCPATCLVPFAGSQPSKMFE